MNRCLLTFFLFLTFCLINLYAIDVSLDYKDNKLTRQLAKELEQTLKIPTTWTKKQFKGTHMDVQSIVLMQKPAESLPWRHYKQITLTAHRVNQGKQFLIQHQKIFDKYEKKTGIPRSVVAAIIGIETSYGNNCGNHKVLESLATLAFYYTPRAKFFRNEVKSLLSYAYTHNLSLDNIKGSYAGAIGIPQFMPSVINQLAVAYRGKDFDLEHSPEDSIASVYQYLSVRGHWQPNQPVIQRAYLDTASLKTLNLWGSDNDTDHINLHIDQKPGSKTVKTTQRRGQSRAQTTSTHNSQDYPPMTIKQPAVWMKSGKLPELRHQTKPVGLRQVKTTRGSERYLIFPNFKSILSYNPSDHYAHAVSTLAELIQTS